jgi:lincosamide nucleotidyltransferase A/C/D/E
MMSKVIMMTAQDVVDVYGYVEESGIVMWLDGGWGVDALLARQLRPHNDLDIAIDWKDVPRLRSTLEKRRLREVRRESPSGRTSMSRP